MKRGKWILKAFVAGILFLVVLGTVTMLLWNWLVPELFHGPQLGFLQAIGLLLLSKILFSGWRRPGRHADHAAPWKRRLGEKWASMTPEERERFKNLMREKWCRHQQKPESQNPVGSND